MSNQDSKSGGCACLGGVFSLLMLAVLVGLGWALFQISYPQDLSDLEVNPAEPVRNVTEVLKESIEGGYSIEISEAELNGWIKSEIVMKQGGELAEWIRVVDVKVRLRKELAEIVVVRDVFGYPLTTSIYMQIKQTESSKGISTELILHGGGYHELFPVPSRGGRFGKLNIPQGFLITVMSDFQKLGQIFQPEMELGFDKMSEVKIRDKCLYLNPISPVRVEQR